MTRAAGRREGAAGGGVSTAGACAVGRSPFAELRGRLAVVSNRLPVRLVRRGGRVAVKAAAGGLVTAMDPVLRRLEGTWIGWDGGQGDRLSDRDRREAFGGFPYPLHPVPLTPGLVERYYGGFSNETLWPLFHDLLGRARFRSADWEAYRVANRRFAEAAVRGTGPGDTVWVQDYHLALVAQEVRRRARRRLLWFLHIPFPAPDVFARLPWREDLLRAVLANDLVGVQTRQDAGNLLACVRRFLPGARIEGAGGAAVRRVSFEGRRTAVGAFPISIDFEEFAGAARSGRVRAMAARLREELPGEIRMLGVDRLDYTKGIPERIRAFERFLEEHPDQRGRVTLVQLAVPSRQNVPEYRRLRARIDRMVGDVNGRFTSLGWTPIHYLRRTMPRERLVAHYLACEVGLVTPLRDGMNLVAKEYCASSVDERGTLVLSEFAGAAAQLSGPALIVNPHDAGGVARAVHRAVHMDDGERRDRMRRLRERIRRHDLNDWVERFSRAAAVPAGRG